MPDDTITIRVDPGLSGMAERIFSRPVAAVESLRDFRSTVAALGVDASGYYLLVRTRAADGAEQPERYIRIADRMTPEQLAAASALLMWAHVEAATDSGFSPATP